MLHTLIFSQNVARFATTTLFLACGLAQAQSVSSTTATSSLTLSQAIDAAWTRTAAARTQSSRVADLNAQRSSADRFLAGSPELTLGHRTDRLNRNGGLREWEAEIEAPIQRSNVRQATVAQLDAQQRALNPLQTAEKLKVAGQLRDLLAQARLAQVDVASARTKLNENQQLVQDIERRLRAGDVAKLDALLAQSAQEQSKAQLSAAQANLQQLLAQWQALTGQTQWPREIQAQDAQTSVAGSTSATLAHPATQAALAQRDIARGKMRVAEADQRDPMAVSLGLARERGAFGASSDGSLRLALRIPFGGDQRNAPKLSAARLELDTAEAELDVVERSIQAELALRELQISSANAARDAASSRLNLVRQAHDLIVRAWRLGERSLADRLRADGERFEAEQSAERAKVEALNALMQLEQAKGILP